MTIILVMLCVFSVILWQKLSSVCLHTLSHCHHANLLGRRSPVGQNRRYDLLRQRSFPVKAQRQIPKFFPSETLAILNDMLIQSNDNVQKISIAKVLAAATAMLTTLQFPKYVPSNPMDVNCRSLTEHLSKVWCVARSLMMSKGKRRLFCEVTDSLPHRNQVCNSFRPKSASSAASLSSSLFCPKPL